MKEMLKKVFTKDLLRSWIAFLVTLFVAVMLFKSSVQMTSWWLFVAAVILYPVVQFVLGWITAKFFTAFSVNSLIKNMYKPSRIKIVFFTLIPWFVIFTLYVGIVAAIEMMLPGLSIKFGTIILMGLMMFILNLKIKINK